MDWDDLRVVLAVGRHGTLTAAARRLGVNHSTVFRRVAQIEAEIGVRLFERHRDGYVPTPAGDDAIAVAESLEGAVDELARRLAGRDTRPSGLVRATTADTLLSGFLGPPIAAFRAAHPEIRLELTIGNPFASLSKRDADVAIRATPAPPDTLVGRRVCGVAWAIYDAAAEGDPGDRPWIGFDDSLSHLAAARWLRDTPHAAAVAVRANSLLVMLSLARAGAGVAPLPCFLGDTAPELRRVRPPIDALTTDLWILTHRDLRHVARVRAFVDFMDAALRRAAALFEGRRPAP